MKADASGRGAELGIVGKEKINIVRFAYKDGRCEVDRIKCADQGRECLAGPLQDSLIYRADRESLVGGLNISHEVGDFNIGDFVQQPQTIDRAQRFDAP